MVVRAPPHEQVVLLYKRAWRSWWEHEGTHRSGVGRRPATPPFYHPSCAPFPSQYYCVALCLAQRPPARRQHQLLLEALLPQHMLESLESLGKHESVGRQGLQGRHLAAGGAQPG